MPQRTTITTILRRRLLGAAATLVALYPVASFVDVACRGPYVTWFNEHCMAQAEAADLVGRDADAVRAVLGSPTSVWEYAPRRVFGEPPEPRATMDYAPHAWLPYAKFQAHLRGGRVHGLEMYDD